MERRDVAIVLSGGGMNGVLLEVGFLQRLRESSLWPRVVRIYGTSAGALTGMMAALDRLDDLQEFVLSLKPEESFRPHSLWRLPLNGLHEYALPRTIGERVADPVALARGLAASPIELVVYATDVTHEDGHADGLSYELEFSSRTAAPELMAQAVMASAAVSALVLPVRVGDRIATDGGWIRNFPLARPCLDEDVELIVAFRYLPRYPQIGADRIVRLRKRLTRFRAVPPVRAFIAELQEAEERHARGEAVHLGDMLIRLMRVSIQRNTAVEEQLVEEREAFVHELADLRDDVVRLLRDHAAPERCDAAAAAVEARFAQTRLPRLVRRITVRGSAGAESLDAGVRSHGAWRREAKRQLIERGWELADEELRRSGLDPAPAEARAS